MELNSIIGLILSPSANELDIKKVEMELNTQLPSSYKELLQTSNGVATNEGIYIYGTDDILERNAIWKTDDYAPGFISIGDDSGGRVILMRQDVEKEEILIVDSGVMSPEFASLISNNLIHWINSGLKIDIDDKTNINWSENCKVVVVDTFNGALKDLVKIKNIFGLNISTSELLNGSKNLLMVKQRN